MKKMVASRILAYVSFHSKLTRKRIYARDEVRAQSIANITPNFYNLESPQLGSSHQDLVCVEFYYSNNLLGCLAMEKNLSRLDLRKDLKYRVRKENYGQRL